MEVLGIADLMPNRPPVVAVGPPNRDGVEPVLKRPVFGAVPPNKPANNVGRQKKIRFMFKLKYIRYILLLILITI